MLLWRLELFWQKLRANSIPLLERRSIVIKKRNNSNNNVAVRIRESVGDDELIMQYRMGNKDSFFILYVNYYKIMVREIDVYLRAHSKPNMYHDDLVDVATKSLETSIKTYRIGNKSFFMFWKKCMLNDFRDFFKTVGREGLISMDPSVMESQYTRMSDVEYYQTAESKISPKRASYIFEIINKNKSDFTKEELQFISLTHYGYGLDRIGHVMEISLTKVYRIRHSIITKLNILMKNN